MKTAFPSSSTRWLLMMIALLSSLFVGCEKSKYESPDYKVVEKELSFEIRDYPELTLVSTPMQKRGEDGSFMRLFQFISGRNERSQKISMTTPVLMTGTKSGTMSFILPKNVAQQGVPMPSNPDVTISTKQPARYAVYCFSGPSKPEPSEAASKKLLAWAAAKNLPAAVSPIFAYYNPPWTPGFMRRNEVLLRLDPLSPKAPAHP
jgi:effector-binding domain-containing protein